MLDKAYNFVRKVNEYVLPIAGFFAATMGTLSAYHDHYDKAAYHLAFAALCFIWAQD